MMALLQRIRHSFRRSPAAWLALSVMLTAYFFSYFQRSAIPGTIFNEIQTDLGLSATAVAGLGSMFLVIYAGSQLFVGMAADRYGGRRTLMWGAWLMTAGAIWFPLARDAVSLYAARALTGLGASFMYLSIAKEVETLFGPLRFPTIMGGVLFVGFSGGMAGTLPFAALVSAAGWRPALLGVAALMVLSGWCIRGVLRRVPDSRHVPVQLSFRPMWEVVRAPRNRPLLIASLTNFSVYFVIQNIVGMKFIQDVAGLNAEPAAAFLLVMAAFAGGAVFLSGYWLKLADYKRKPVLLVFGGILLAGTLLLALAVGFHAPAAVFLGAFILLSVSQASGPIASTVIKETNRADCVAQSIAVLNSVSYLGVSLVSALAGAVLDRFEAGSRVTAAGRLYPPEAYRALFVFLFVIAAISFIAMMRVAETRKEPTSCPACLN